MVYGQSAGSRSALRALLVLALVPAPASAQDTPRLAEAPHAAHWSDAIEQARAASRELVQVNSLPGLSVAVGANGVIAYSEGLWVR